MIPEQKFSFLPLTPRQKQVLEVVARLDYEGSTYSQVGAVLSISKKTVETYLTRARDRLGTHDIFSTIYRAYAREIITLEDVVDTERVSRLEEKFHQISPRREDVLKAYIENALQDGFVGVKVVAPKLNISLKTLETHITRIYNDLEVHNQAQFATAAYVHHSYMWRMDGNSKDDT
ncbi:LuxR family transcriptional regulator [Candidatus Woesearchaeota archaeon]|nr:LuxR family transcriptional regulator [Candidatus Woesearchaeota archaeon]